MQFTQSQRFKSSLLLLAASGSPDTTQDDAADGGVITGSTQVEYNEEAAAHRNSSCYQPQGQLYSLLPLQPADASHHRNFLSHPPTNNSHSFKSSASWNGAAHNYSHRKSPAKTAGSGWRQGHGAANSSSIPTGDANQYARSSGDSPVPTCVGEQQHPGHHRMPSLVTISPQPSRGIHETQVQNTGTSFAPVAALQPAHCASQVVSAPVVDASGILAALTALLSTQLTGSQLGNLGNMNTQQSQQSLNIPSVLCQPSAAPHTSTVPAALPVPPTKPKKPKAKQSRGQQAEPELPLEKPSDTKAAKSHVTTGKGKVGYAPSWLNASMMQGSEMISETHTVKDEEQRRFASATEINTFLKAYEERNKLLAGDPSMADEKRLELLSHLLIPSRPLAEAEVSRATAPWIHQLLASASSIERIFATPSNSVITADQKETLIGHLNTVERLVCSLHVEMERRREATELSYEQDQNSPLAPRRNSCLASGYFAFLISCEYAATQVLAALAPFNFIDPTSKDKQLSHVSPQVVAKALLVASMLLCDCVLSAKKGSSLNAPNAPSSSPFALTAAAMALTIKAAILRTHAENLDETEDFIGSSGVHTTMSLFLVSAAGVLLSSRDLYTKGSRPTASPPQLPEPVPPSPFQMLNAKLPIRRAQRWAAIASESISGARRCFESLGADPPPPQSECTRGPRCHESMLSHTEVKSQAPTSSTSTSSSLAAYCAPVILPLLSECRRQHLQLRQKATPAEDLHSCPSLLSPKVCARHMTAFLIEDTLNAMCGVFD